MAPSCRSVISVFPTLSFGIKFSFTGTFKQLRTAGDWLLARWARLYDIRALSMKDTRPVVFSVCVTQ